MRNHYLPCECQADTGPAFPRREERYEDLGRDVLGHARAIVDDLDDRITAPVQAPV